MGSYQCSDLKKLNNLDLPLKPSQMAYKMELFLIRGKFSESYVFWEKVSNFYEEDLTPGILKTLHFRVAALAYYFAKEDLLKQILSGVPEQYKNLDPFKILSHCLLRMQDHHGPVFPFHLRENSKYKGPHLFKRQKGSALLTRWIAGRVESVENEMINTIIKEIESHNTQVEDFKADPERSHSARFNFPASTLSEWKCKEGIETIEIGRYFEIVEYGKGKPPLIKFWPPKIPEEWDFYRNNMPPVQIDPLRYLRLSKELQGDSFIEKCERLEETIGAVDDYVEKWHNRDVPFSKRGWSLADYLGMMPDEYREWVDNPASLAKIVEKRSQSS